MNKRLILSIYFLIQCAGLLTALGHAQEIGAAIIHQGNASYQSGAWYSAQELFNHAAELDIPLKWKAYSYCMQGNCFIQLCIEQQSDDQDPDTVLLEKALDLYRKAFKLNPDLLEAVYNGELALKNLRNMRNNGNVKNPDDNQSDKIPEKKAESDTKLQHILDKDRIMQNGTATRGDMQSKGKQADDFLTPKSW